MMINLLERKISLLRRRTGSIDSSAHMLLALYQASRLFIRI